MKRKLHNWFIFLVALNFLVSCINQPSKKNSTDLNATIKNNSMMNEEKLTSFGQEYALAWCSQQPESVAAFFAPNGSLKVNAAAPAVGRKAIAIVALGFMTAFPDMIVAMDSLHTTTNGIEFHWTLTGTNSGIGGTGNKVKISGLEIWQMDKEGLILESNGSFDAAEYSRQLKEGFK